MAYPIYPGMDVKFMVETFFDDFQLTEDDFEIKVMDPYGRTRTLQKDDCFWDTDGRYYITLEKLLRGTYHAYFRGSYEDDDYDKQQAVVTDAQRLLTVPSPALACGCEKEYIGKDNCRCRHRVRYTLVWTVSIDGDDYLCDCDGKYILTSDGKRICFKSDKAKQIEEMGKVRLDTLTGEQFKQLIEGRNPNNEIDTLPEMLDAAQGISDEETIHEHTEHQIEQELEEEAATNEDIDEMFAEQEASTQPTVPTQPMIVEEEEEP